MKIAATFLLAAFALTAQTPTAPKSALDKPTLEAYLRDHASPTREEVRDVLSGNLCRCTGYQGIVDAALQAARARASEAEEAAAELAAALKS